MTDKSPLTKQYITTLKAQAHRLNPIVFIGQKGLTPAVINETNNALQAHELIKVRIFSDERLERMEMAETLCQTTQAHLVQHIGKLLVLYRQREDEKSQHESQPNP